MVERVEWAIHGRRRRRFLEAWEPPAGLDAKLALARPELSPSARAEAVEGLRDWLRICQLSNLRWFVASTRRRRTACRGSSTSTGGWGSVTGMRYDLLAAARGDPGAVPVAPRGRRPDGGTGPRAAWACGGMGCGGGCGGGGCGGGGCGGG